MYNQMNWIINNWTNKIQISIRHINNLSFLIKKKLECVKDDPFQLYAKSNMHNFNFY